MPLKEGCCSSPQTINDEPDSEPRAPRPTPSTSHLEPLPKVRTAYRKLAEAKDAEATSAKAESLRQKEENRLRVAARAEASAKEREAHRRFLESLK
jgi:hypothetical protein